MPSDEYKCRVGFIDDNNDKVEDYIELFRWAKIEMRFADGIRELNDIYSWILDNQIECFMVDYNLVGYSFNGNDLITYLTSKFPGLFCLILTNYPQRSLDEKLIHSRDVINRSIFSGEVKENDENDDTELNSLYSLLIESAEIFRNFMVSNLKKYKEFYNRRHALSATEYERLVELHKQLVAYSIVDDVSSELLDPSVTDQLRDLLDGVNKLLDAKE